MRIAAVDAPPKGAVGQRVVLAVVRLGPEVVVAGVGVAVSPPRSRPEKQPLAAMARTADAATRRMKGLPEMKLLMVIQTLRARGKFRAEGGDTGRSGSGVQDSEPEVFLERVEVAVGVE